MSIVKIFTDGSCRGNPGPGGWAAILIYKSAIKEISGGEKDTTNNRMELQAVIEGLKVLKKPCLVEVYTDSMYVRDGLKWRGKWKRNGWKTVSKRAVKNKDLWLELENLESLQLKVTYNHLPGHSGIPQNERADQLAKNESGRMANGI